MLVGIILGLVGLIFLGLLTWLFMWIKTVPRTHFGVRYTLEKLGGLCESGLTWRVKAPHCGIHLLPKQRFELAYDPRVVISKKSGKFGKQMLLVAVTVYTEFERKEQEARDAIERGTPTTEGGLIDFTDSTIESGIRLAAGNMSWTKATEKDGREEIKNIIGAVIKEKNSVFKLGGLNTVNTDVRVRTVDLESQELKRAIAQPDIERLLSQGAVFEAERITQETKVVGEIRKMLIEAGFPDSSETGELAHSVWELQVTNDLQRETKMSVVRLIRFQGTNSVPSFINEAMAAITEGKGESPSGKNEAVVNDSTETTKTSGQELGKLTKKLDEEGKI